MTQLTVSVVIVTRHRPKGLAKALRALLLQIHQEFEIVVVGEPDSLEVIKSLGLENRLKHSLLDEDNIAVARNLGIALAAGDVIAFIDDDAIAEPTWLTRLTAPFFDPGVAAAGGFVRGRNGISFQWRGEWIGNDGSITPLEIAETKVFDGAPDRALKTHGTNCAFRRDVLVQLGGFDPNFRFFLEDSDLNLRLSMAGYRTAIVPAAEVQHGFASSVRRTVARVPLSLFEIGASFAYFLQRHGQSDASIVPFVKEQRLRLLKHMVSGGLEPRQVIGLMRDLKAGLSEGKKRRQRTSASIGEPPAFFPLPMRSMTDHNVYYASWRQRRAAYAAAHEKARAGESLTLMVFSRTTFFHRRWFHPAGFWVQTGGQFGKSLRDDGIFQPIRAANRALREQKLVEDTRGAANPPLPIATQ